MVCISSNLFLSGAVIVLLLLNLFKLIERATVVDRKRLACDGLGVEKIL